MMGEREFGTKLYYQLSLDGLVPQDHLLRRIARAVDFAFVRRLCRPFYSHSGQIVTGRSDAAGATVGDNGR